MSDGYISSINGLGHIEDYYMSGWMLSYNDDDCDNYGMDYITLSDNDNCRYVIRLQEEMILQRHIQDCRLLRN